MKILNKSNFKIITKIGVLFALSTTMVLANDADAMPLELLGPLEKIMNIISGPLAQMAGVICIVIAGLGIAFGEGGSGTKKLFQVVMGLAIAFTAASIVSKFFGATSGLVF